MSIQQARLDLAKILTGFAPAGWKVRTETLPEKHTGTIEVGHANVIEPSSYRQLVVELAVTLWCNEADAKIGVSQLYDLLSPGADSIWKRLSGTVAVPGSERTLQLGELTVGNIGPRDDGPTGFLAADITIRVRVMFESEGS